MLSARESLGLLARIHLILAAVCFTPFAWGAYVLATDPPTLAAAAGAGLLLLLPVSVLVSALLLLWLRLSGRWDRVATLGRGTPLSVLIASAVTTLADPLLARAGREIWVLGLFPACAVAAYWLVGRRNEAARGLDAPAVALVALSIVALPAEKMVGILDYRHRPVDPPAAPPAGKRGMVVVVVDGLGAEYISALNPGSPIQTPNFDRFIQESTAFTRARADYLYTLGAFNVLYSGRDECFSSDPRHNLLRSLQDHGVNVRLAVTHLNAFPERGRYQYRGLRSLYLSQNYVFLPRWLRLDYHVLVHAAPPHKDNEVAGRGRDRMWFLRDPLNEPFAPADPFQVGLSELDELASHRRPFFLLMHTFPHSVDCCRPVPPNAGDLHPDKTPEDRAAAELRIRSHDYRYEPGDQWRADELRTAYLGSVTRADEAFGEFVRSLRQRPYGEAVDIVLTADHGSCYEGGHLWYSYHVTEPVTWIPMVHYSGSPGSTDDRLCETLDLPATVLDWFGLDPQALSADGSSLMRPPTKQRVVSVSGRLGSGQTRAALYEGDRKHVFGIAADGAVRWEYQSEGVPWGSRRRSTEKPLDVAALEEWVFEWTRTRHFSR